MLAGWQGASLPPALFSSFVDSEGGRPENKRVQGILLIHSPLGHLGGEPGSPGRREVQTIRLVLFALLAVLTVQGCGHLPMRERDEGVPGRPAPAVEGALEVLRPVYPPGPITLEALDETASWQRNRFGFQVYCDQAGDYRGISGEYYRSLRCKGTIARPLIAISPILGGEGEDYLVARFIARECCRWGFSAYFLYQERSILSPSRDALGLEARMRRAVRDNISALDAFSTLDEIDSERMGSFGVSLGAIRNVAFIAAEPRLKVNVLCLGGLDLGGIIKESKEKMVLRYLSTRKEREGLSAGEVELEFQRYFFSNPERWAASISPGEVLLFLAVYDEVVPYTEGLDLRRMLGTPEAYLLPLGHYTAFVAAPWITSTALKWVSAGLRKLRHPVAARNK